MKFEDVLGNERLWAVVYDGDDENILVKVFDQWYDVHWLKTFFEANIDDLTSYFHISNIDDAIYDTQDDADSLSSLILDSRPDSDLDTVFRHLENHRAFEMVLGKEKARGKYHNGHPSWLRLYALRLGKGSYLLTGGTIKLTKTMEERMHTLQELMKMEQVRNYLLSKGAHDMDGLIDLSQN